MGRVQKFSVFLAAITLCLLSLGTKASTMEKPAGEVILTVSGNIKISNSDDGTATFDQEMLTALPSQTIETTTPWTDGVVKFEGPLLRDVLKMVGGTGQSLKATAYNDYSVNIPAADFTNFDVILAYKRDGDIMTLRSKGPLWIIYPWDTHDDLRTELFHSRSIWQLRALDIQ